MSGGSKSRSSSTQNTSTTITSRDTAIEDVDGTAIVGGEGDISVLDGGAIEDAFYFAENVGAASLDAVRDTTDDALDFGRASLVAVGAAGEQAASQSAAALNTLSGAIDRVANASRSDASQTLNNIVRYGALTVAGIAAAYLLTRGK